MNETTKTDAAAIAGSNMLLPILSQQEIEEYFVRCDFDDECDCCDNPEHGSYAVGYSNTECGMEVDSYICGKCASKSIPEIIKDNERLDAYLDGLSTDQIGI